jgi:hypothetical protein
LGGRIHTIKKNTEIIIKKKIVVASKRIGLEVNADKTKYKVMSGDQNAGRSHSIKFCSSSFERAEQFKFWEQTLQIKIPFRKKLRAE